MSSKPSLQIIRITAIRGPHGKYRLLIFARCPLKLYPYDLKILLSCIMPQSFVTTPPPPPPPGHSGELNTNQVLKTVNFPTPGAKLLVKPPV